jgi:hypothetical protein
VKCVICRETCAGRTCSPECHELNERLKVIHRVGEQTRPSQARFEDEQPNEPQPVLYGLLTESDVQELQRRRSIYTTRTQERSC